MRHLRILILLSLGALFLSALPTLGQDTETLFQLYSDDPVISHSPTFDDWDGRYTDPGAAFYHDGQFHMFRNGFRGWPASVQIGYLTSPDGLTWTEASEDPVLMTDDVAFAEVAALASSALVESDGTWVLYFYTWNKGRLASGAIGRATADNPLGPWTVHPEPVLIPGSSGGWDSLRVTAPSVLPTDDGYVMYYGGANEDTMGVGMATSADGVTWTKYDDPATTEAPFAESDPVLVSNREGYDFHQPRVESTENGYVMIFRHQPQFSNSAQRGQMGLGAATSSDGIQWNVVSDEPFWERSTISRSSGFWFTATAHHDDTLYLYIEGGRGSYTDIYAATAILSLFAAENE
jgi:hypothetical protein